MNETLYTVGRLAELTGTTIRTIQYYDKIGLLVAKRYGDKNSRLYNESDLVKLQQILFYRKLGLSLKEIQQNCLSYNNHQDLMRILEQQQEMLFRKEMEIKADMAVIGAILSTMTTDNDYNLEAIMKLTLHLNKSTILEYTNIAFDPKTTAAFQENDPDHDKTVEIYWRWKRLLLEAISLKYNGIKPDSDSGYRLGKKWAAFIHLATNDNKEMMEAYLRTNQQSESWPAEDKLLMDYCDDFIENAYHYYLRKEDLT
ncbi:MerR family transcriptional regulator [Paenibacillus mendelii]|uniref:MerR family transcriptional regulator n=1 Tax=Paenibacillus mendelii TaxID=206163 RepID=A0ABV6JEH1_9BACL|nr:MerR family transcriptional regulator [Paenibacillus mendelii]MCQ6557187.1 MerR family transcriptional regulator [Paenibacillus mendelii]